MDGANLIIAYGFSDILNVAQPKEQASIFQRFVYIYVAVAHQFRHACPWQKIKECFGRYHLFTQMHPWQRSQESSHQSSDWSNYNWKVTMLLLNKQNLILFVLLFNYRDFQRIGIGFT